MSWWLPNRFCRWSGYQAARFNNNFFLGGALSGIMILNGRTCCLSHPVWFSACFNIYKPRIYRLTKLCLDVSQTIWETCKTYLFQQGKFLVALWILIAICMIYYFGVLQEKSYQTSLSFWSVLIVGILGSYTVAWFGIRINTWLIPEPPLASLSGDPLNIVNICLRSGMSVDFCWSASNFSSWSSFWLTSQRNWLVLVYRFCYRWISWRFRSAYLRWYLHQDCRYRFRPDENRFPSAGRRPQKPGVMPTVLVTMLVTVLAPLPTVLKHMVLPALP